MREAERFRNLLKSEEFSSASEKKKDDRDIEPHFVYRHIHTHSHTFAPDTQPQRTVGQLLGDNRHALLHGGTESGYFLLLVEGGSRMDVCKRTQPDEQKHPQHGSVACPSENEK